MKRKNRGFTLIELLAVIVILGLLMAIAIPSVTKYITQSRKKTLTTTIGNYIGALTNQVNDMEYVFTGTNTIYAVPIECIALERGGTNPFGEWLHANSKYWAYVLVQYDDATSSYTYGFTFKDSAGYGLYPTTSEKLKESGSQINTDLDLTKPTGGPITNVTAKTNWNGFDIGDNTQLHVLDAADDGVLGDGVDTCTLCQKGKNYETVKEESNKEDEETLNSYNFYYNRLYRWFDGSNYMGYIFRENNIATVVMSGTENFEEFYEVGDIDLSIDYGLTYDMLPVYNGDELFVGFLDEGKKLFYDGAEFELTDIELQYSIYYSLNGGIVSKANPTKYTEKTKTFTLNNPTKEGYNFLGWTYSGASEPQKTVTITKGSYGNKSYTAKWEIDSTLSNLIKVHNTLITASPTLTTSSNKTSDASGLYLSTATNSGQPTYYFRGNVTNNYVSFAGLTWYIIRINEDGTVRLILKGTTGNRYTFNSSYNNFSYSYYSNGSNTKTQVDSWYKTNITDKGYDSYVSTGTFCEQAKVRSIAENTSGNATTDVYTAYTPNFKCSTDGNGKGILNSKAGLITYDEIIHAGGYYLESNSSYYLRNISSNIWTMSPSCFSTRAGVWYLYYTGSMSSYVVDGLPGYSLSPVINLNANVKATGTGTSSDPYVVQ